jgi:outer membrane usher protein
VSRFKFRNVRLWTLFCALTVAQANAQNSPDALCAAPEALLDISVAGASRGGFIVRLQQEPLSALIPSEALRSSEQAYIDRPVTCDGQPFVALSSAVTLRYDEGAQRLLVRPVLSRLQGQSIDLRRAGQPSVPVGTPSWGVEYGLNAATTYTLPGRTGPESSLSGAAHLGVAAAADRWSGAAGVLVTRESDRFAWQPRLTLEYALNDQVSLGAAYQASPMGGNPGLGGSDFVGIGAAVRNGFDEFVPEQRLDLPLESEVTIYLNRTEVTRARVSAGTLRLLNIPRPQAGLTVLTVDIEDETGLRTQEFEFEPGAQALPPGAYLGTAELGRQKGSWTAAARAEYGLPLGWRAGGQMNLRPGGTIDATVQAARRTEDFALTGSVRFVRTPGAPGTSATSTTTLNLQGERSLSRARVSAFTSVPLGNISSTVVGATVTTQLNEWALSAQASTAFQLDTWTVTAAANRTFGTLGNVVVRGAVNPGGWRLSVGGAVSPAPRWEVSGQVQATRVAGLPVSLTPGAAATYSIDPGNRVRINVNRDDAVASYSHVGRVLAQTSVGTSGAEATVSGAVAVRPDGLSFQAALGRRAILLRTGVPGLPIRLNGAFAGTTNAAGDIVLADLDGGQTSDVTVDLSNTPFGVTLSSERLTVVPPRAGLTVVDWRSNFSVSRWVQFFWKAGEPAAAAAVTLPSGTVLLDDEGYGLIPGTGQDTGTLRLGDRSCSVRLAAGNERATCTATGGN